MLCIAVILFQSTEKQHGKTSSQKLARGISIFPVVVGIACGTRYYGWYHMAFCVLMCSDGLLTEAQPVWVTFRNVVLISVFSRGQSRRKNTCLEFLSDSILFSDNPWVWNSLAENESIRFWQMSAYSARPQRVLDRNLSVERAMTRVQVFLTNCTPDMTKMSNRYIYIYIYNKEISKIKMSICPWGSFVLGGKSQLQKIKLNYMCILCLVRTVVWNMW